MWIQDGCGLCPHDYPNIYNTLVKRARTVKNALHVLISSSRIPSKTWLGHIRHRRGNILMMNWFFTPNVNKIFIHLRWDSTVPITYRTSCANMSHAIVSPLRTALENKVAKRTTTPVPISVNHTSNRKGRNM